MFSLRLFCPWLCLLLLHTAHCWPASSDCVFRADYHPCPSTPIQVSQSYHGNMAFFPLRTIWRLRAATLIPAFPLSGQCVIIGRDPGPVWETARLFPAFTQHIMSLSRPSTSSSWRVFSGPGDVFFPQVETNQLCWSLRSLPSVTGEALNPMALLIIGVIPTVSFHLPFQPWAIFASVLWGFFSFSLESGYVPKIICIFLNCLLVSILYVCGNSPPSVMSSVCHIAGTF